jgi:hypothetical protein
MRPLSALAIVILICLADGRPALADEPSLYLSWHAPYGAAGASETLTAACGDSLRADTLYLSFDPGRDSPTFYGMIAVLNVRASSGDSLGPYWSLAVTEQNRAGLRIELGLDYDFPAPQPWKATGTGRQLSDKRVGSKVISMLHAVKSTDAAPVQNGTVYCFGRLVFLHRGDEPAGCGESVCIEWESAQLGFGPKEAVDVASGGSRFVTWNSADGTACEVIRARPARWKAPKGGTR